MDKRPTSEPISRSLLVLTNVVKARDPYTGEHCERVACYARLLGKQLGLSEHRLQLLSMGASIHDLGKVGVPDTVLHKEGPLSDFEYRLMQRHPAIGYEILKAHPLGQLCRDAVLFHHERYDGTGYPARLRGREIPLFARIVSVADMFDALTSIRPYRHPLPLEEALDILAKVKHVQLDGDLVEAFLDLDQGDRWPCQLDSRQACETLPVCPLPG